MKIGILGGSFDPVHNGHIHMAISAYQFFHLDKVWLIPAGHSPNKNEADMTDGEQRFQMCRLASQADARLEVSRIELDSPERSYTYRTLERLHEAYPDNQFFFIMGGDSLNYFEHWVRPERICELATILVIPRDQFDTNALEHKIRYMEQLFPCDIQIVPCSQYAISSTQIREALQQNHPDAANFPPGVLEYIQKHKLYD